MTGGDDDGRAHRESLAAALSKVASGTAFALVVVVASWWLIGDRSVSHLDPDDLDYLFRAPEPPGWVAFTAGSASVALALATGRRLLGESCTRRPAVKLLVAGVAGGFMARVLTAGVIGANIGGGLALLFGLPLVGALGLTALLAITRSSPSAKL